MLRLDMNKTSHDKLMERACRICHCTKEHGCMEGCAWAKADLCTACDRPGWRDGLFPAGSGPRCCPEGARRIERQGRSLGRHGRRQKKNGRWILAGMVAIGRDPPIFFCPWCGQMLPTSAALSAFVPAYGRPAGLRVVGFLDMQPPLVVPPKAKPRRRKAA